MPKYLWDVRYTHEGASGLVSEGASGRRAAIEKMVGELGGSIESFYYSFGDSDAVVILDLPDDETAAAVALQIGASGKVRVSTRVLLTIEQIDAAAKKTVGYRPPGG